MATQVIHVSSLEEAAAITDALQAEAMTLDLAPQYVKLDAVPFGVTLKRASSGAHSYILPYKAGNQWVYPNSGQRPALAILCSGWSEDYNYLYSRPLMGTEAYLSGSKVLSRERAISVGTFALQNANGLLFSAPLAGPARTLDYVLSGALRFATGTVAPYASMATGGATNWNVCMANHGKGVGLTDWVGLGAALKRADAFQSMPTFSTDASLDGATRDDTMELMFNGVYAMDSRSPQIMAAYSAAKGNYLTNKISMRSPVVGNQISVVGYEGASLPDCIQSVTDVQVVLPYSQIYATGAQYAEAYFGRSYDALNCFEFWWNCSGEVAKQLSGYDWFVTDWMVLDMSSSLRCNTRGIFMKRDDRGYIWLPRSISVRQHAEATALDVTTAAVDYEYIAEDTIRMRVHIARRGGGIERLKWIRWSLAWSDAAARSLRLTAIGGALTDVELGGRSNALTAPESQLNMSQLPLAPSGLLQKGDYS